MKIRIEANSLATNKMSGIGYYAQLLTEAIAQQPNTDVSAFSFSFLHRQPTPRLDSKVHQEQSTIFPLRVYAKLQSYGIAFPFDVFLKRVDLTIFPNYARWPSVKSGITATTIHDLTYIHHPDLVEEKNLPHLTRVVARSISTSDFIITISEAVKQEIVDNFPVDAKKIIVTGIPPDAAFYKKNTNEIHKKYGIPTKDYIFFISTIEPRKNLPLLIEAYSMLPQKLQEKYSLVISGGMGWKSAESKQAMNDAQEAGLNVVHTGYVDDVDRSALYQQAALHVLPSFYEGFGMSILEAAASKTPIVATDIPVLREVGGKGVEYFTSNDSDSLVQSITKVLTSTSYQKELIKNASEHLKTFSWQGNAELIINTAKKLDKRN